MASLGADCHLGVDTAMAQQTSCNRGALQAKHSLGIPRAGVIDRGTGPIHRVLLYNPFRGSPPAYMAMHFRKIPTEAHEIKGYKSKKSLRGE